MNRYNHVIFIRRVKNYKYGFRLKKNVLLIIYIQLN